ncbi:MAG: hypothetical protein AAGD35_16045 [Actinomycetota bacterium]
MSTRDDVESLLKGWDAHERSNGRQPIVDFDCFPEGPEADEISSRIQVYERLVELLDRARADDNDWLIGRLRADIAYVSAMLGQRLPLADYIRETQGATPVRWPDDYVERRRVEAVEALAGLGIDWGPSTLNDLEDSEGRISPQETADEIRAEAERFEAQVRELVDTDAPFTLNVEEVEVDAYWAYWMDGVGERARLRINLRNAQFTKIRARQLALHEIHGHALQGASFYQRAQANDVPWARLLSVHGPQQILLEGLAQAFPHFIAPDDEPLMARTRLTHYIQLVRGQMHLMVNEDRPVMDAVDFMRSSLPFSSDAAIADAINDRSVNTQLRSYLWSYGSGMDWFVELSEQAPDVLKGTLRRAYREPLQPEHLHASWAIGQALGVGQ